MTNIQIFGILSGIVLLLFVLELVRRKKLLEGYSLIWILACVGLIIISLWENLWFKLAKILGIIYAPLVLFIFAFFFLVLIVLDFSIKISKLTEQNKKLVQKIGIIQVKKKK
ncbi:MAG: DUF2304 domain-containing protein [Actinobacteria bacterium]|nr:DUF2304 domain-containing protein [Actinomycetota bacterium]